MNEVSHECTEYWMNWVMKALSIERIESWIQWVLNELSHECTEYWMNWVMNAPSIEWIESWMHRVFQSSLSTGKNRSEESVHPYPFDTVFCVQLKDKILLGRQPFNLNIIIIIINNNCQHYHLTPPPPICTTDLCTRWQQTQHQHHHHHQSHDLDLHARCSGIVCLFVSLLNV